MISIGKSRGIFDSSFSPNNSFELEKELRSLNLTLILIIDELQYMYPEPEKNYYEEELNAMAYFIREIAIFAEGGHSLIIAAGSSVTLADKALHAISSDVRLGRFPKLNDQKIHCVSLLPILSREEFKNALETLVLSENYKDDKDVNAFYVKTGGVIRRMNTYMEIELPKNILEQELLIRVLLLFSNPQNDPFYRKKIMRKELLQFCRQIDESFRPEQLNIWCDEGYLLYESGFYSCLVYGYVMKLFEITNGGLSIVELRAFMNPAGVAGGMLEGIIAEGITEMLHWEKVQYPLTILDISIVKKDTLPTLCKKIFKPMVNGVDKIGFGKFEFFRRYT